MQYKKPLIIATTALTIIGATTEVALTKNNQTDTPTKQSNNQTAKTVVKSDQPVTEVTPVPANQTETISRTLVAEVPPTSNAMYGEDPNQPGVFIVFDKQAFLDAAGIPDDQQELVSNILSNGINREWHYKSTVFAPAATNICNINPGNRMASAGDDWDTNPVTQLKWCHQYVVTRYGGWQNVATRAYENHSIF